MQNRIAIVRAACGLTTAQLSAALNVPEAKLSAWETGDKDPSIAEMVCIANTFCVSMDFLLCRSSNLISYHIPSL